MRAEHDADAIVIGGGPAGSTAATRLAQAGHQVILLERDVFPREHVGEALTPSTNNVLRDLGVLAKVEEAGLCHKAGVGWTAPRSPLWKLLSVRTSDYPPPDAVQPYSYNVERAEFDAILLRHAKEQGVRVLQGVGAREVLFEDDRAVGVRASVTDGWERELGARVVIDATGRRCMLANQLGLRRKDRDFNQFSVFSWFEGLRPSPAGFGDFLILHFLGLPRAWAWQIPMKHGRVSVGVVTEKSDFQTSGVGAQEFFASMVARNRTLAHVMAGASPVRPFEVEGDYSYDMSTVSGDGWLLVGDALRFVDPIFSSGVDVALYSGVFAAEAVQAAWQGDDERSSFETYGRRVSDGVDIWYRMTQLFYDLQLLFTWFMVTRDHRRDLVRVLQGNPYMPETQQVARRLIDEMTAARAQIAETEGSLLRPAALSEGVS
ncbi:NAD(P)/FAD-dependent oxidoreductase [soil metagenome]